MWSNKGGVVSKVLLHVWSLIDAFLGLYISEKYDLKQFLNTLVNPMKDTTDILEIDFKNITLLARMKCPIKYKRNFIVATSAKKRTSPLLAS